jgi:DDE domain
VKVAGQWRYVYRAIDQFGQVIDDFVFTRRNAMAAHRFFERAIGTTKSGPPRSSPTGCWCIRWCWRSCCQRHGTAPTDTPTTGSRQIEGLAATDARPKQDRSARVMLVGHGFVQNLRRGHYELAAEEPSTRRLPVAIDELAWRSDHMARSRSSVRHLDATQQRPSEYGTCKKVEKRILPAFGNSTSSWPAVAASGRRARPNTRSRR